jgi:diguanylate cyclase (GGDEF)-like protein/PAS domain S-box-containing protein
VIGARVRQALVVVPVLVALVVLLLSGILLPGLIDPGPGPGAFRVAVLVLGLSVTTSLGVAALRSAGRLRLSWAALSLCGLLWTLATFGALAPWNPWLVWAGLRAGTCLTGVVSMTLVPNTRRTARAWGLILLDGWLVGGSVLVIGWVALAHTGSPLTSAAITDRPMLYWVPVDLLFASVVAGLAMRTDRRQRVPVLLMVLVSLLGVTGDTTWALTGDAGFPVVQWLIMMFALGGATTSHRLDLWQVPPSGDTQPSLMRWSQVAVVPGLVAALTLPTDPIVLMAASSVILVMAGQIVVISRQNHELWSALRLQARRLDLLVSESRDAIVQVSEHGVVEFANDAVADLLGHLPPDLIGRNGFRQVHCDDRPTVLSQVTRLTAERPAVRVSGRFRHADGSWRYLEATVSRRHGGGAGYTLLARDVTERVSLEADLRRLAGTDALTGLLNRHAFLSLLGERLAVEAAVILFVDLDGFKAVNDSDGHAVGDRLLGEVADALRAELGPGETAARLGGDEFAILAGIRRAGPGAPPAEPAPAAALAEPATALAERIAHRLRRMPSDAARRIGASVGVAVGRRGSSAEALLGDADLAMYEAKAAGGRRHVLFEPRMRDRVLERARVIAALEQAAGGAGLKLDVQPIVSMRTGQWVGFEALVRWQDGPLVRPPGEFLPLAEETGLIVRIGTWVLCTALNWLAGWPDPLAGISVNITGRQVAAPGFADLVSTALRSSGVAPDRLTLEITEQTAVEDIERAAAILQPLRALGVHVSLDDFGTGFSSLGYLAQLPVDELKIDRRFVCGLGSRPEDDALVRAVTGLAADLGLRVIAEGVETPEQVTALLDRGCTYGHGYLFSRPTPIDEICPPAILLPPARAMVATDGPGRALRA